ncbi:MAG TPA: DUF3365 domain-containing protein [Luteimonas sp.]|nr:DUF3365 domain-containing protein [Luteimonas sp.]HRO26578.1 DUF3365 domain-containing protein [Luteimonas sp.]HRP71810.1 DUF3365 domain-containing protein [Luteimonas sp.]
MNRRIPLHAALACLGLALATGCSPQASDGATAGPAADASTDAAPETDPALERARAAAMAFSGQLRERLQGTMAEGGPLAAVEVCHADAPRIAEAVMAEHGLRLGRVAAPGRNRNPAQAADDWTLATLETFQQAVDAGAAAGEQVAVLREDLPEGVALRMMRGIATEPGCLACHGSDVAPEVREAIARHYPDDAATGFAVGDLRGALWVEVPAATH